MVPGVHYLDLFKAAGKGVNDPVIAPFPDDGAISTQQLVLVVDAFLLYRINFYASMPELIIQVAKGKWRLGIRPQCRDIAGHLELLAKVGMKAQIEVNPHDNRCFGRGENNGILRFVYKIHKAAEFWKFLGHQDQCCKTKAPALKRGLYEKLFSGALNDVHGLYEAGANERNDHGQVFPMQVNSSQ